MLLRQIEYLQAVIENGNFYLAAEQCNVSQSAISQQIADNNNAVLRIGYYKGYHGNELSEAIALFSEKYPTVDVKIMVGSHEELYHAMEYHSVDLAINDQRRAFSDAYNNEVLAESKIYIELSIKNPLSKLSTLEAEDLKNTPCILVINQAGQKEEQHYYETIIGLQGDFLFADTVQEARLKIITGQGYMPVDVIGEQVWFDTSVSRIPLVRNQAPVKKTYCAFWKKENSGYYIEEFAQILKSCF